MNDRSRMGSAPLEASPGGASPGSDIIASILMPVRNAASFLDGAVESALGQTCRAVEVVAVDDGSTDGTHEALCRWAERDPRMVVLRHAQNQGVSAARNSAIERARGRWLAVLDADDAFAPERIERLVALADGVGADLFADNPMRVDFQTKATLGPCLPEAVMTEPGQVSLATMVSRDRIDRPDSGNFGYLKPLIRRDFLLRTGLRYRPEVRIGEDFLLYFECVAAGARFHLTPGSWYRYSVRADSVSSGRWGALELSVANRRMLSLARRRGDKELHRLLLRRQASIDNYSFDLAVEMRRPVAALRYARYADPRHVGSRLRAAAGVAWNRGVRSVAAALGRATR